VTIIYDMASGLKYPGEETRNPRSGTLRTETPTGSDGRPVELQLAWVEPAPTTTPSIYPACLNMQDLFDKIDN